MTTSMKLANRAIFLAQNVLKEIQFLTAPTVIQGLCSEKNLETCVFVAMGTLKLLLLFVQVNLI